MPLRLTLLAVAVVLAACTRPAPAPAPSAMPGPSLSATPSAAAASPSPSSHRPTPTGIPASLGGQDFTRIPTTRRIVALTFDAGASADGVASILATLEREQITATFFLTGDFVRRYPQAAKSLRGHRLGNHTMTHPHLPALPDAQLRVQVLDAQDAIRSATGSDPRPWFRFPYGDSSPGTVQKINALGYVAVRWTVDSLGWQGTARHSAETVVVRVLDAVAPGQIVLMHVGSNPDDGSTLDADALPAIIQGLRARGYAFVTLDALLTP